MTIVGVHHVSINVADVEAALEFYVERLGLTARADRPGFGFGGAWLDAGAQQVHLIEADVPEDKGQHLAFQVVDLDAAVDGLRAGGVAVSDPSPVGTGRQAFLRDPSGNLVELHQAAQVTQGVLDGGVRQDRACGPGGEGGGRLVAAGDEADHLVAGQPT